MSYFNYDQSVPGASIHVLTGCGSRAIEVMLSNLSWNVHAECHYLLPSHSTLPTW